MENNTKQKESKKSLFDNVFFVSFLFIIALADLIYRAIQHEYSILNISFVLLSLLLIIKNIKQNKKLKS